MGYETSVAQGTYRLLVIETFDQTLIEAARHLELGKPLEWSHDHAPPVNHLIRVSRRGARTQVSDIGARYRRHYGMPAQIQIGQPSVDSEETVGSFRHMLSVREDGRFITPAERGILSGVVNQYVLVGSTGNLAEKALPVLLSFEIRDDEGGIRRWDAGMHAKADPKRLPAHITKQVEWATRVDPHADISVHQRKARILGASLGFNAALPFRGQRPSPR